MENNHSTSETCSIATNTDEEALSWMEQGLKYYRNLMWLDELKTSYLHPSTHSNIEYAIDRLVVLRDMERNSVWCGDLESLRKLMEEKVRKRQIKRERKLRNKVMLSCFSRAVANNNVNKF